MLSFPLILLGSVLIVMTIVILILFMITGEFRSPVSVKVLIASGTTGVVMLGLGEVGMIYGFFLPRFVLTILVPVLYWGPIILCMRLMDGLKVGKYIRSEYIKPFLRFLIGTGIIAGAIFLFDVVGLWVFLYSIGQSNQGNFRGVLTLLLLLEGPLICVGAVARARSYGEYRLSGQATMWPALASYQAKRWRERRLSQPKRVVAMLIAGGLLTFLGLLVGFLPPI